MDSDYQVLKRQGIAKYRNKLWIVFLVIICLSGALAIYGLSINNPAVEYINKNENSDIVVTRYDNDEYEINGQKLTLIEQNEDNIDYKNGDVIYTSENGEYILRIPYYKGVTVNGHPVYYEPYEVDIVENLTHKYIGALLYFIGCIVCVSTVYILSTVYPNWTYTLRMRVKRIIFKESTIGNLNNVLNIELPNDVQGLVCARRWRLNKQNKLKSLGVEVVWDSIKVMSDEKPQKNNTFGVYSYRLDHDFSSWCRKNDICGLVEITGKCIGHENNIIRSEKARILALVVKDDNIRNKLIDNYNCPIFVSTQPVKDINNWVYSKKGVQWLLHNANVFDNYHLGKIEKDIIGLNAYKSFGV